MPSQCPKQTCRLRSAWRKIVWKFPLHRNPMRLNMSSAIRIDCVDPFTDSEPLRDVTEGTSLVPRVAEEFSYWIGKGQ